MTQLGYTLLEAGDGFKWEKFGKHVVKRPLSLGYWPCTMDEPATDFAYIRKNNHGCWDGVEQDYAWSVNIEDMQLELKTTGFGHVGLFPEHQSVWQFIKALRPSSLLNLFAYTGGASIQLAKQGAKVVHVDASKSSIAWAQRNAKLNSIDSIRWILEDAARFVRREKRRENQYDCILLDPPTFGRGAKQEVFKIEEDLVPLLEDCHALLGEHAKGIILSCHTPGWTGPVLENLLSQTAKQKGKLMSQDLFLKTKQSDIMVPCGTFAHWRS